MFLWNANYMYRVPVNVEDEFCVLEGIQALSTGLITLVYNHEDH